MSQLGYFAHGYSKRFAFGPARARRISAEGRSALVDTREAKGFARVSALDTDKAYGFSAITLFIVIAGLDPVIQGRNMQAVPDNPGPPGQARG